MAVTRQFTAYVLDQLHDLGDVRSRSMFGGTGLYCDDIFFGIIASGVLYLKVGEANRREYEAAGMKPFKPYRDKSSTMKYYEVPLAVLESPTDLVAWARRAVTVAAEARPKGSRE